MTPKGSIPTATKRWPLEALEERLAAILREAGVDPADASSAAAHMVEGAARGHLGHGVERVFEMLEGLSGGVLRGSARRETLREGPAFAVLSGGGGLGAPAAIEAVDIVREKSVEAGVAAVGIVEAGHLGVLAPWAEAIAEGGNLGLAMTTTEPAAVFPGGSTALLGTNPIAYAFEADGETISVDFATVEITRAELLDRCAKGEPLSVGVAVDEHGEPTVSPDAALRGGLLPLGGGLKGAWVNLLVGALAGPAIGAAANHRTTGTRWMSAPPTKGDLLVAVNLDLLSRQASFGADMAALLDSLEDDVPGFHRPGSGAQGRREEATRLGVPVSEALDALLKGQASTR